MRDLSTTLGDYSGAVGINDAGQVVVNFDGHVFVTGPNGEGMTDLNSLVNLPNGRFHAGAAINNQGVVLAYGSLISSIPSIPEPEIYALLLAGLALVGFMARRKKAENPHGESGLSLPT